MILNNVLCLMESLNIVHNFSLAVYKTFKNISHFLPFTKCGIVSEIFLAILQRVVHFCFGWKEKDKWGIFYLLRRND